VWDADRNVSHTLNAGSVRDEVNASLDRLQMDTLDLCQIHWPAFPPGSSDAEIEEGWTTLAELVADGKIRHIGVSNFDVAQLGRLQAIAPITSLQPPYSALMRQIEDDILPYCAEHDIGVIVYSPMHSGMLTGRMTPERIANMDPSDWRLTFNPAFKEPLLSRNLEFVEVLREIGERHSRSVAEVAIAWTLKDDAVTGAIVGARSADQVDGFAGAMDFSLNDGEIEGIAAELPESIPLAEFA
jgi:aryl-alcohol dehydrogenase-like predicted oxidoreductase